jgi:hypothetical protein
LPDGDRHQAAPRSRCFTNACGTHGWGKGRRLGRRQNEALPSSYKVGGKECVIRTFFCDAKG